MLNRAQALLKCGNAQSRLPGMKIFDLGDPVFQLQNDLFRQSQKQITLEVCHEQAPLPFNSKQHLFTRAWPSMRETLS